VANWTAGEIDAGLGAIFFNNGTFNANLDNKFIFFLGGSGATFANIGTFNKNSSTGVTNLQLTFNNVGTVVANTGTIALSGGGFATGRFQAQAGALIDFTAGNYSLNPGASFTGPGL